MATPRLMMVTDMTGLICFPVRLRRFDPSTLWLLLQRCEPSLADKISNKRFYERCTIFVGETNLTLVTSVS